MQDDATSPLGHTSGHDIKSTVLEHDIAEPLYSAPEEIARCRYCGRETLWADREFLTHRDDCEVAER